MVISFSMFQEVLVRFAGFGPEEDEWVNVRRNVRPRSLPCESSECVAVLPGDLILCFQVGIAVAKCHNKLIWSWKFVLSNHILFLETFIFSLPFILFWFLTLQEGKEQALYFDAHVLDAQRRRHDVRGCRCRFLVRYDHDQSEVLIFNKILSSGIFIFLLFDSVTLLFGLSYKILVPIISTHFSFGLCSFNFWISVLLFSLIWILVLDFKVSVLYFSFIWVLVSSFYLLWHWFQLFIKDWSLQFPQWLKIPCWEREYDNPY